MVTIYYYYYSIIMIIRLQGKNSMINLRYCKYDGVSK